MKPVLLDTGVIVACLDRSERLHSLCSERVASIHAPLVTCEAVIAESCYLLRHIEGTAHAILENIAAGVFQIPFQLSRSTMQIRILLTKYRDQEVDLADACLVTLANALDTGDILTLDRDFGVYRWGRNKPFNLLVPLV